MATTLAMSSGGESDREDHEAMIVSCIEPYMGPLIGAVGAFGPIVW